MLLLLNSCIQFDTFMYDNNKINKLEHVITTSYNSILHRHLDISNHIAPVICLFLEKI